MYRRIDDFLADWAEESKNTARVLSSLTDESLAQRVSPEGRSAGRLAWHLAATFPEMMGSAGLTNLQGPAHDEPIPERAAEIVRRYEAGAASVAEAVRTQWTDEMLGEVITMYGEEGPRGHVLSMLIRHEAHHRGQLTVLMRQAGLAVPGCYGPAREEWSTFGMPAMD